MKRAALHNLGCKVNAYETEAMQQMLEEAGYEIVPFQDTADVYVINTCSVTNMADRKSRQMLHRAKAKNPKAVVVACGCYVQTKEKEAVKDASIDLIIGNNCKNQLVPLLDQYFRDRGEKEHVIDINRGNASYEEMHLTRTAEHTRAFIKVQDGCNQFCSYCIIPYARGRVRSRHMEDVLGEVKILAQNGYKEVVLTGIHLSSYGVDTDDSLLHLIQEVHKIEGIERIRLGSLEPRIVTQDAVRRMAALSKLCPHFHLSLQSGCDATLKRMNRHYDTAQFEAGVRLLREAFDRVAVTTDVIVGFPGETEEEFEETLSLCEEVRFDSAFTFLYSVRKGTPAAEYENQIPEEVKHERFNRLVEVINRISAEKNSQYVGKTEKVLVDGPSKTNSKTYGGRTETFKLVNFRGNPDMAGKIVNVRITSSNTFSLEGEVVSE